MFRPSPLWSGVCFTFSGLKSCYKVDAQRGNECSTGQLVRHLFEYITPFDPEVHTNDRLFLVSNEARVLSRSNKVVTID